MRPIPKRLLVVVALLIFGLTGQAAAAPAADMSQGNPKAKVTVIEYASVDCPYCRDWFKEVYPAFKAKYIDTGKINFITREMLVGGPEEAGNAAAGFLLARCAGKANYYRVTDAIFADQDAFNDDPHDMLLKIGKSVGLSEARVQACITNQAARDDMNARVETYSTRDHVNSTPTFVINGKMLEPGYHPLKDLDAAIATAQGRK